LPPYSPDFSPIENLWSKIKSILRSLEARTYPDLVESTYEAFDKIALKDIKNWFTNCSIFQASVRIVAHMGFEGNWVNLATAAVQPQWALSQSV
jgi:hypothetical protein